MLDHGRLWLLEIRLLQPWLAVPLAVGLLCGLLDLGFSLYVGRLGIADGEDLRKSLVYGEMLLPLVTGWTGTRVVLGDRARDLMTVTATPLWQLYLRRLLQVVLAASLVWSLSFGLVLLVLQVADEFWMGWRIWLGGLTSIFFFGICGYAASLALRDALSGQVVTALLWCGALISLRLAPEVALLHPFLTYADVRHPAWGVNRLGLGGAALLLLGGSCWQLSQPAWLSMTATEAPE